MSKPIKNPETEKFARDIAHAIHHERVSDYEALMNGPENPMDRMKRWEVIALRERVHAIVAELKAQAKKK